MLIAALWARLPRASVAATLWHNRSMKSPFFALVLGLAAAAVQAHEYQVGSLTIEHPHARPTAPSQPTGGGYLKLVSKGPADRLTGASAAIATSVQLHSMRLDGDVMRMREVDAIELPAGQTVELKPGGLHLMFLGLKAPLLAGQKFPLKLTFEKAGDVTVQVTVDAPAAGEAAHKAH
jgi:copper(I)-binding protein